jgi:hypothetical protein
VWVLTSQLPKSGQLTAADCSRAPLRRLRHGYVFVVDHRLQRRPGALFSRGDRRMSLSERGQYLHRQTLEPPFAVDALFAQHRLGI